MPARKLALSRLTRTYRGTKFVLEEVDAATYDDIITKATETVTNALTGEDEERVNEVLVIKLLLKESLIEPKSLTVGSIGQRLRRALEQDVRALHFGMEPDETPKKNADDEEDEAEEEDPNQASA